MGANLPILPQTYKIDLIPTELMGTVQVQFLPEKLK